MTGGAAGVPCTFYSDAGLTDVIGTITSGAGGTITFPTASTQPWYGPANNGTPMYTKVNGSVYKFYPKYTYTYNGGYIYEIQYKILDYDHPLPQDEDGLALIPNEPESGPILPDTGGPGRALYTACGLLLLAGATMLVLVKAKLS